MLPLLDAEVLDERISVEVVEPSMPHQSSMETSLWMIATGAPLPLVVLSISPAVGRDS
jgi:hypothetical protein